MHGTPTEHLTTIITNPCKLHCTGNTKRAGSNGLPNSAAMLEAAAFLRRVTHTFACPLRQLQFSARHPPPPLRAVPETRCRHAFLHARTQTHTSFHPFDAPVDSHMRTEQVAFWSAARDPSRDESSLSARLSALSGPRLGLPPQDRTGYLAKCVGLVVGVEAAATEKLGERGEDIYCGLRPPRFGSVSDLRFGELQTSATGLHACRAKRQCWMVSLG